MDATAETTQIEIPEQGRKSASPRREQYRSPVVSESEQRARVRRTLGLGDRSPLEDVPSEDQDRRAVVENLLRKRSAELHEAKLGFIDQGKEAIIGYRKLKGEENPVKNPGLSERVSRWRLKAKGVSEIDGLYQVISTHERDNGGLGSLLNSRAVDNLKQLTPDQLELALGRMEMMGYYFDSSYLRSPAFSGLVRALAEADEAVLVRVCQQLNEYTLLPKTQALDYQTHQLTPEMSAVLTIISQGGLNPEQKQRLDLQERFALLDHGSVPVAQTDGQVVIPDRYHPDSPFNLKVALDNNLPPEISEKMLAVVEDAVFRLNKGQKEELFTFYDSSYTVLLGLVESGDLDKLYNFCRQGIDCSSLYGSHLRSLVGSDVLALGQKIKEFSDFIGNAEQREWILLLAPLVGEQQFDIGHLGFYQELFAKRQEIIGLALVINALPKSLEVSLSDVVKVDPWAKQSDSVKINTRTLIDMINRSVEKENINLSEDDQIYCRTLLAHFTELVDPNGGYYSTAGSILTASKLPLLVYLAENKGRIGELVSNSGKLDVRLIEEILWGKVSLSPAEINELLSRAELFYLTDSQVFLANWDLISPDNRTLLMDEITPDQIKDSVYLTDQEKPYWLTWKELPKDVRNYMRKIDPGKKGFINQDGSINIDKLNIDFINEVILTPERIRTWESLTTVFARLDTVNDSAVRAFAYLRIAEALSVQVLTERTEVEALSGMSGAFSRLYRPDMSRLEKRTWHILRRKLPMATNEMIRGDMRNQAVRVESVNQEELSWVHQAVHNFVRAQTPDYIRALRTYLEKGDQVSIDQLQKLAMFYTADSRPGDSFYREETRQRLQGALPEINQLVSLTEAFYEISPGKVANLISGMTDRLQGMGVSGDLEALTRNFQLVPFLERAGEIRVKIQAEALASDTDILKNRLIALDTALADLHQKALARYLTTELEPKIASGTLTDSDYREAVVILRNAVLAAVSEGEYDFKSMRNNLDSLALLSEVPPLDGLRALGLQLAFEEHMMNREWGDFIGLAREEMSKMLVRMGYSPEQAQARVMMEDLVQFEKSSYKFALEPFLKTIRALISQAEGRLGPAKVRSAQEVYLDGLRNQDYPVQQVQSEVIGSYIGSWIKAVLEPEGQRVDLNDNQEFVQFLDRLAESSAVRADKLVSYLLPGYVNKQTGQREVILTSIGKDEVGLYPFFFYGAEGVVMAVNGKIVEDPLNEIKRLYRSRIVPAMEHALREGD